MAADHALAIDVGTQSVRAILFDPSGNLVAMGRVPIEPYVSPQPGWAEQDPEVWWTAIGEACRRLWADPVARPDSVAGVALTTQCATIVVSDRAGQPLRPAIVWLDARRTDGLPPAAAAHRGLRPGTRLIAAAGDKQCEALGAGAISPEIAGLSFGTTASIGTTHRRYVEAIPLVPPYRAAIPGAWFVELDVFRGFWMVEWFKREFGADEVARAAARDIPPEGLFEDLLAASPPGAMGLVLQPYWMPGIRYPGPKAKGAVLGFGDVHGRAHLYRAILEGLAY